MLNELDVQRLDVLVLQRLISPVESKLLSLDHHRNVACLSVFDQIQSCQRMSAGTIQCTSTVNIPHTIIRRPDEFILLSLIYQNGTSQ